MGRDVTRPKRIESVVPAAAPSPSIPALFAKLATEYLLVRTVTAHFVFGEARRGNLLPD